MTRYLLCALLAAASLNAAAEDAAKKHTVVAKDNLWQLAKKYYSNPYRWKVIYAANHSVTKDPHWIYPGQVFEIPDVPNPAIGDTGARPIETGAKIVVPPSDPGPEPASQPAAAVQ